MSRAKRSRFHENAVESISVNMYRPPCVTMLRPRKWWEATFRKYGAVVNRELLWAMQEKDKRYTGKELHNCQMEGDANEGGLYEVCSVDNSWLVGRREQENVRKDRCVTTENMELEPWFFTFRKLR